MGTKLTLVQFRTSTTSARASVFEFVKEEDGRTYHRYRQGSEYSVLMVQPLKGTLICDILVHRIHVAK
jgi:hypothetical protein